MVFVQQFSFKNLGVFLNHYHHQLCHMLCYVLSLKMGRWLFYTLKLCFFIRISLPVRRKHLLYLLQVWLRLTSTVPRCSHLTFLIGSTVCSTSSAFHKTFVRSLDNQAAQCLGRQSHTLLHETKSGNESFVSQHRWIPDRWRKGE